MTSSSRIRTILYGICVVSTLGWMLVGILLSWSNAPESKWFFTFVLVSVASLVLLHATHYAASPGASDPKPPQT